MDVEPPPKYVNGELNSQIGMKGQDSHFSEVKWDSPNIHASCGVLHIVSKAYECDAYDRSCTQVLATVAECGTTAPVVLARQRTATTQLTKVYKDKQPSTNRYHLDHTSDTCPYPIHTESYSSIITQNRLWSDSQTHNLATTNTHRIWHRTPAAA
jgi:hypothetical protein